jgi:hypothetical protein
MITRRNMRCLVTAGKHVNNTRAIAWQLLGKRVPAAMGTHATVEILLDYNNGKGFFYVVHVETRMNTSTVAPRVVGGNEK